ncbi:flagella assembly cyclic-di-GMP phosphodiesterase TipF [Phenylobacterium montanum]|uniref:EAL domain-containing protein n=1 Tax=Phenylobacterium montanum TaxID=2823693 RepID=A0A975FZ75_9CAUL|nr:EAL domain-containing protein [Caulobacter sp. S6]QUD87684.1 EAL domain-containing protein [Caulobacter sp. S6]
MRKVTTALLAGAYLCLALTAALLIWRGGGGWGAGVAALIGGLGLALALHGQVSRIMERGRQSGDLADVRDAHVILANQLEKMHDRVAALAKTVATETFERSEILAEEIRRLDDAVQQMSDTLEERLSMPMVHHSPVHYAPAHHAPPPQSPAQLRVAEAMQHHSAQHALLLDTVREAMSDNRIDLYLQPIVGLPQRRTVFYESFSRLRDATGRVLMPAEYLTVAEPEGLMSTIDNLLLFRCAQIVRRLAKGDRKVAIFCNISLASLGDEQFFPQFLEFLSQNRDMAKGLVFELGQAAFERRGATEARNMAKLADLGFRFSLDKVTDLDLDFQDLARADVKYVKVTADTLIGQLTEEDGRLTLRGLKDIAAADFADLTRRYGVELIAEKIESERQVVDILELNIGYGQGNLFGEPRAIRDQVLAEAEPPADFVKRGLAQHGGR